VEEPIMLVTRSRWT